MLYSTRGYLQREGTSDECGSAWLAPDSVGEEEGGRKGRGREGGRTEGGREEGQREGGREGRGRERGREGRGELTGGGGGVQPAYLQDLVESTELQHSREVLRETKLQGRTGDGECVHTQGERG